MSDVPDDFDLADDRRERLLRRALRWALYALVVVPPLLLSYYPALQGRAIAGRDIYRLYFADASHLLQCLLHGELPLWVPFTRLGQPFAATIQSQAFYPPRVLGVLLAGPYRGITLEHLLHVGLAIGGTALACRRLGTTRLAALVSGTVFGLGALVTQLNWEQNVANSLCWSGFVIAAALGVSRQQDLRAAAFLALSVAASFFCGAPEILMCQAVLCAAVALGGRRRLRAFLQTVASFLWGMLLAGLVFLPAAELALNSGPPGGDALAWSTSPADLLSLFWPAANWPLDLEDGQAFLLTLYQGTLACSLAALAWTSRITRRRAGWIGLAALFLLVLSLGRHFRPSAELLGVFPFKLFRHPVKYALVPGFAAALFAGLGFDRAVALARRGRLFLPGLAVAALTIVAVIVREPLVALLHLPPGASLGLVLGSWSLGAAALSLALIPRFARSQARRVAGLLATILMGELAAASLMCGPPLTLDPAELAQPSSFAATIRQAGFGRVSLGPLNQEWNPPPPGAVLEELLGFTLQSRETMVGKRFIEHGISSIDGEGAPVPKRIEAALAKAPRGLFDLSSVEWFVRRGAPPFADLTHVADGHADAALDRLFTAPVLYRNPRALPHAFVVHRARAATEEEAIAALEAPEQAFRTEAFLSIGQDELPSLQECEGSRATVERAGTNRVTVAVEACGAGVLILTDAWYPGWRATVDGHDAALLRADHLVRGVPISAGKHTVDFVYRPLSFKLGLLVSALASGLVVHALRRRTRPVLQKA